MVRPGAGTARNPAKLAASSLCAACAAGFDPAVVFGLLGLLGGAAWAALVARKAEDAVARMATTEPTSREHFTHQTFTHSGQNERSVADQSDKVTSRR
jgi:hypothetical protein